MRDHAPSRTAEFVALIRAAEQRRRPDSRVLDDPYAHLFLRRSLQWALAAWTWMGRFGEAIESIAPGVMPLVVARHRRIDEALEASLRHGVDQVLILGAGYDTRAWRFAEILGDTPVFEVDHPATARRKQRILANHKQTVPAVDIRWVSVDFEHQSLRDRLLEHGFRQDARTFVIWEGVTMYLSQQAIVSTLGTLQDLVGPASEIALDLWYELDTPGLASALLLHATFLLTVLGEPITFGLHPKDIARFMNTFGLTVQSLDLPSDLEDRYGLTTRRIIRSFYVARLRVE